MEFSNLKKSNISEITNCFNLAFSDYMIPIHITPEILEQRFNSEGFRSDLSVGIYENEQLIGFIMHFYQSQNNSHLIYNGGTGVIPAYRGRNLTLKMYEYIKPTLQANTIDASVLEVLTNNLPAINIYKKEGFDVNRELLCYKADYKNQNFSIPSNVEIKEIEEYDWNVFREFWDFQPTWQNSESVMENLKNENICTVIFEENVLIGYLIFNPKTKKIGQIAIKKTKRNMGFGKLLLDYTLRNTDGPITVINVDSNSLATQKFLEKNNFKNFINQFEMVKNKL